MCVPTRKCVMRAPQRVRVPSRCEIGIANEMMFGQVSNTCITESGCMKCSFGGCVMNSYAAADFHSFYFLWTPQSFPPCCGPCTGLVAPFLGCSKKRVECSFMRTRHRICLRKWHIRAVCDRWRRARPEFFCVLKNAHGHFSFDPCTDYRWLLTDNLRSRVSIRDPMRACNTGHPPIPYVIRRPFILLHSVSLSAR